MFLVVSLMFLLGGCASNRSHDVNSFNKATMRFSASETPCISCVKIYRLHNNIKEVKNVLLISRVYAFANKIPSDFFERTLFYKNSLNLIGFENVGILEKIYDVETNKFLSERKLQATDKYDLVVMVSFKVNKIAFYELSIRDNSNSSTLKDYIVVGQNEGPFSYGKVEYGQLNLVRQWYEDSLSQRTSRNPLLIESSK